jgi:hypothetical protein
MLFVICLEAIHTNKEGADMDKQSFDKDFFNADIVNNIENADDFMADDEVDRLFSQLGQMEPPAGVIENILNTVSRLPLPQYLSDEDIEEAMKSLRSSEQEPEDSIVVSLDGLVAPTPHLQHS